jgi:hypothetical protein
VLDLLQLTLQPLKLRLTLEIIERTSPDRSHYYQYCQVVMKCNKEVPDPEQMQPHSRSTAFATQAAGCAIPLAAGCTDPHLLELHAPCAQLPVLLQVLKQQDM